MRHTKHHHHQLSNDDDDWQHHLRHRGRAMLTYRSKNTTSAINYAINITITRTTIAYAHTQ
jgi:hypothetical protein